jgi:homoserine kinase
MWRQEIPQAPGIVEPRTPQRISQLGPAPLRRLGRSRARALEIRLARMSRQSPIEPRATHRVRVSASTSNLGPGFDVLGLAIDLELSLSARQLSESGALVLIRRDGEARHWPGDEHDLALRAFRWAYERLGGARAVELAADSRIPLSRGLGSSGAAIAAGLLLGEALAPRCATREQLLAWAVELEGHPDNVAPALFGGCVFVAPPGAGPPRAVQVPLHPSLGFAVAWPDAKLETSFARSLLPREVPHRAAVDTARRLACLLEGLRSGDPELLGTANDELLHVPYRLPHIPAGAEVIQAARDAGAHMATISGSGSALFAISARADADRVAAAMHAAFEARAAGGGSHAVQQVPHAPEVERVA